MQKPRHRAPVIVCLEQAENLNSPGTGERIIFSASLGTRQKQTSKYLPGTGVEIIFCGEIKAISFYASLGTRQNRHPNIHLEQVGKSDSPGTGERIVFMQA